MSTTKSNLEKSSFCSYVIAIWKNSSHDHVSSYLKGAILNKDDVLYEELTCLYKLRKFMADENREDRWSEESKEQKIDE